MSYWKEPFDIKELIAHSDERGNLFEILRFKDFEIPPDGLLYTFSVNPGARRGDHYHKKKQEWFTCVFGSATILLSSQDNKSEAITIDAKQPQIIYAGPGTTHAVINNSYEIAVMVSYGSKQHDPKDDDTYRKIAFPTYQSIK